MKKITVIAAVLIAAFCAMFSGAAKAMPPSGWTHGSVAYPYYAWYAYTSIDDEWMYLYAHTAPGSAADFLPDEIPSTPTHVSSTYDDGGVHSQLWSFYDGTNTRTYLVYIGTDSNLYYKYYSVWYTLNEYGEWQGIYGSPPLS
jgi:hypothetical protein